MTQIKLRRDTSANFTSANPVLGIGEPAYETDTKKLKIGDGTTAYTQLEYFSTGGGGSSDITATLPLKIVDGIISLEVDGQTIQIVDGKLHANLDDKQDKFETQIPLSISSSSITTSVAAGITETEESWTGGGPDKFVYVNVSVLNIDANSDWKIHLSGYIGDYHATNTNTNALIISTENEQIFRVWFGSRYFRLGNGTNPFERIPDSNREFFYEIGHQNNGTEFTFNGTSLIDSTPLPISVMSRELGGQAPYTTLKGKGKLKEIAFVINSYQFQRIDKDISKSYFEADGVKYPITSIEGINTLKLVVGDGLSVVDGKLTASSTAPANMVTTDTSQTITGQKEFSHTILSLSQNLIRGQQSTSYRNGAGLSMGANSTSTDGGVFAPQWKIYSTTGDVDRTETIITTYNQSKLNSSNFNTANKLVRLGSDGKLPAIDGSQLTNLPGGSSEPPANMVTTDTTQTITGLKTFGGTDLSKILLEGSKSLIGFRQNSDSLPTTLIGGFFDSNGKKSITIGSKDHETLSLNAKSVQDSSGNKFLTSGDKETIMGYMTPDFDSGIDVPLNEEYICPYSGYFILQANSTGNMARAELFVYKSDGSFFNAFQCAPNYGSGTDSGAFVAIQLSKGTKIKATIPTANKSHYSILFPFKGGLNNA